MALHPTVKPVQMIADAIYDDPAHGEMVLDLFGGSGNPKGWPKGAKNKLKPAERDRLRDIILEEAYRTITVREAGEAVTILMATSVVRSVAVNAAKGRRHSQKFFAEMLAATERERRADGLRFRPPLFSALYRALRLHKGRIHPRASRDRAALGKGIEQPRPEPSSPPAVEAVLRSSSAGRNRAAHR